MASHPPQGAARRRVYAIGAVHVPETNADSTAAATKRHRCLDAVWAQAASTDRLWYAPRAAAAGTMTGPPGNTFGLYALKYAAKGIEVEGMDDRVRHVGSLDRFMTPGVCIRRSSGCGPVRLMLLSNDSLLTLSHDPTLHAHQIPSPDPTATIVDAAAGEAHYVLCTSDGSVYTWGWSNEFGQQGRGPLYAPDPSAVGRHEPRRLPQFGAASRPPPQDAGTVLEARRLPNAIAVNCGRNHTVVLAASRAAVYTFGRGNRGQLGLSRPGRGGPTTQQLQRVDMMPTPRCVPCTFGITVQSVVCASDADFTMLLGAAGALVVWGDNTTGLFGLGNTKSIRTPTVVSTDSENPLPPSSAATARTASPSQNVAEEVAAASTASTRVPDVSANGEEGSPSQPSRKLLKTRPATEADLNPLRPRRIPLLAEQLTSEQIRKSASLASISASLSHSAVVDEDGRLLTAGMRPLRVARNNLPVNALGPLGRRTSSTSDALCFRPVKGVTVAPGDTVLCGAGYTALLSKAQGVLYCVGTIATNGAIVLGGGAEAHDFYTVEIGTGRRVVDIAAACDGGLLVVMDDVK